MPARSSCCTRGAACHRDCCHTDTYASRESNPGGAHSGAADDGDGSACERTRIARRHGTDGAANEGHHRGAGVASGAAARVGDAQVFQLGHRAVLGGQRAIETVDMQIPTPARNRTRGGGHSGGADDGDGSACERTRIARRHGTDGAVNEGHRRGAGTAPGAAARVGDAQVSSSVIVLYSGGSVPSRLLSYRYLRQPGIEPGGPTAEERTTAMGQRASGRGSRGAMARTAR